MRHLFDFLGSVLVPHDKLPRAVNMSTRMFGASTHPVDMSTQALVKSSHPVDISARLVGMPTERVDRSKQGGLVRLVFRGIAILRSRLE